MWTEPSSALVAGVQSVVLAAGLLGLGYLVAHALVARLDLPGELRWALALPGLMAFAAVLMVVHALAGGHLLSSPGLVRALTAVTVAVLGAYRLLARRGRVARGVPVAAALCVAAVVAVWGVPAFTSLPLNFEPDTDLHMGWVSQLLDGAPTPTSPVTGPSPNYYPWLYHALVALAAPFTPGGRAFATLGALQLVQVAGSALGLFALGRALTNRTVTGMAAVAFGALLGGLGVFVLGDLGGLWDALREGGATPVVLGDVFARRTYTFAFNNVAPPLPRDLTFALLPVTAAALTAAVSRGREVPLAVAGVVLGLIGLTGGEGFLVGMLAAVFVVAASTSSTVRGHAIIRTTRTVGVVVGPALAIYALWAGPLLLNYLQLGGFVNTTRVGAIVRGPAEILASWSVALPFALIGAAVWLPQVRARRNAVVPLAFTVVPAAYLAGAGFVPRVLGDAFLTFGRDHRYWSLLSLGVCVYAALGATAAWDWVRPRAAAVALAALVVAVGIATPVVSSLGYDDKYPEEPLVGQALRGDAESVLNVLAQTVEGRCRAAVPLKISRQVFAYTGFKLLLWRALPQQANWGRVRFADLAESRERGFERLADNQALTLARPDADRWEMLARSYDIDVVAAPARKAGAEAFGGRDEIDARAPGEDLVIVRVGDCD